MTDTEYFEEKVKAYLLFCWSLRTLFLTAFIVLSASLFLALVFLLGDRYRSTIQFAKLDYDFWSVSFYTQEAAALYLKDFLNTTDGEGNAQTPDNSNGAISSPDLPAEALETPNDFVELLIAKVPRGRLVGGVVEVELVTKSPEFVDKVFYPMVSIARNLYFEASEEREKRIRKIYDDTSHGSLTQKQREAIEEAQVNLTLSNAIKKADVGSAIDTREIVKNEKDERSLAKRIILALVLSFILFCGGFLIFYMAKSVFGTRVGQTASLSES